MTLGGNEDLDALLKRWPAPLPRGIEAGDEEERGWEARADAIVHAAKAGGDTAAKATAEALFEAPSLSPEPGEEAISAVGEKKMSQEEKETADPPASTKAPMSTVTPVPSERKRTSLKEIAARASQAGARPSVPGAPPSSAAAVVRPPPSSAVRPTPASTPPPSRPVEAGKDDSGVINLQVVHATATAQQVADAEKAKPAQAGLFEDEKTVESAEGPKPASKKVAAVAVLPQPQKKSNAGLIGGVVIAVVGIAAAFAITTRKPDAPPPAPVAEKAAPAVTAVVTAAPVVSAAPTVAATAEPAPSASADSKVADAQKPALGGPLPAGGAATAGTAAATVAAKGPPLPSGKVGDLQSEMAKAVGAQAKADAPAASPEQTPAPAAGGPKNLPEQPSQGAVAAAFGPVMGSAKACVAGADDVSRASVTFASGGSVTSVSVSGWAAANGKSGCVQAALKAAKVNPFSKPSFTVGVPIRP